MRQLEWWEIQDLERRGSFSDNWDNLLVHPDIDLARINGVRFTGHNTLGKVTAIMMTHLEGCTVGDGVHISKVSKISNMAIGDDASIINSGTITMEPDAPCGIGVEVAVLDETGSSPVHIYPGLSAQTAMLMARKPRWAANHFKPMLEEHLETLKDTLHIGQGARIENVRRMSNVIVGNEVVVSGAACLINGRIINNSGMKGRCLAYVGTDVDAENFIIEDGVADGGSYLRNVYIGQGAVIDKRFTAHDSLFFANCSCENGEACAIFAGPYTVTMHKSTLLIASVTSFMNAGSGTNQSNHMYKLGPIHWGIMERGAKTSSDSYIMWGARIGAFSLLMGTHKNHPDSSQFPFSYLFGDVKGGTTIVPAKMLKSCGLMRDELKWPTRDRRLKRKLPLLDRIQFAVLNPVTVGAMLDAIELSNELLSRRADDDLYIRHNGMKVLPAHLDRAINLYSLAILKYLYTKFPEGLPEGALPLNAPSYIDEVERPARESWVDLCGQLMPRRYLDKALEAETLEEIETLFTEANENYESLEREWIMTEMAPWLERLEEAPAAAALFDRMIEEDRQAYRESLDRELKMLDL